MKVVKQIHHSSQRKIHGAQAEDREHIRCIDDKSVGGDRKHGGDRIHRKEKVAGLGEEQNHKQRSSTDGMITIEELTTYIFFANRKNLVKQTQNRVLIRNDFCFALLYQIES